MRSEKNANGSVAARRIKTNLIKNLKHLVERGADINCFEDQDKVRPIHFAAQFANLKILKYLANNGADINAETYDGQTAFDLIFNLIS